MRPAHHRTTSQREKGKSKQLDPTDVLNQLNQLLENLLIPISLPDISVVTSSLLLAVIESILERRFLALNDSARTSRSLQSRSNCLKIILKVLNKYLDPIKDHWSSDSINFIKLIEGDSDEVVKIINGLIKLSKQPIFHRDHKDPSQSILAPVGAKANKDDPEQATDSIDSNRHRTSHQQAYSKRLPNPNQFTSIRSNFSCQSSEPRKIPFDGIFSPLESRFNDEPSSHLSSRASSTTSSAIAHSLNQNQQDCDNPLTGQLSNPPTLRNLLGSLQAQFISSKRPQSPRTAHRVMVNKLRNEGVDEEIRDQTLNHDTDTSLLSTNVETVEEDETFAEKSPYQYMKGSSMMMTLDGIEPDDPFVSMETRRALESQIIQNQTTATFDFTQWAVDGDESDVGSFQPKKDLTPPAEWKEQSRPCGHHKNHSSSSNTRSSCSANSHHHNELLVDLEDQMTNMQQHHLQHRYSDPQPFLNALSSNSKNQPDDRAPSDLNTFGNNELSSADHYGFGKPTRLPSFSTSDNFLNPNPMIPSSIPLPPSPSPSTHDHNHTQTSHYHKICLASDGAQLNLIVADVIDFEREKENSASKLDNSDWSDIHKLSEQCHHFHSNSSLNFILNDNKNTKSNKSKSTKFNLISKKLELLKLLNQAYNNNSQSPNNGSYDHGLTTEEKTEEDQDERSHQDLEQIIEKEKREKNVRIRVTRRAFNGIHQTSYDISNDNLNDDHEEKKNQFIVLNGFNLLGNNFKKSINDSSTDHSSACPLPPHPIVQSHSSPSTLLDHSLLDDVI